MCERPLERCVAFPRLERALVWGRQSSAILESISKVAFIVKHWLQLMST